MTSAWTRRLPAAASDVLESVAQHRLLTTAQVHAIHTPTATRRWTQRLLAALADCGLLAAVRGPRTVGVWFVTAAGAEAVEQFVATRTEPRRKLITPAHAAGPLQAHTLAVNDVGIAYLAAARQRGDEFGPLSWRHEIAHPIATAGGRRGTELLVADGLISYVAADADAGTIAHHQRLLELDRGTMPVEALLAKLRRYRRLRDYTPSGPRSDGEPAWRAWYPTGFPAVQVVLAGKPRKQLERRLRLLLALRAADPGIAADRTLHVQLALLDDLTAHGPFAPIWLRADDTARRVDWLGRPKETARS